MKKPAWLNKKINIFDCRPVKELLKGLNLNTVCQEALCPNISECFKNKTATFMILGNICTRNCAFCAVQKGKPLAVDFSEPIRIKQAVKKLNLDYVVITSPTRDDLSDGGAEVFCRTVKEIKSVGTGPCACPLLKIEILIPDFLGKEDSISRAACSGAEIIAHNLETVPSLYNSVRKGAIYERSLKVLETIKKAEKNVFTKSGLMLGLGEKREEIIQVLRDLRKVQCNFLTLGQYLPPSANSYLLKEYVSLDQFAYFKKYALEIGFKAVQSSPYTRSSYLARSLAQSSDMILENYI
ncbi:MAG: lipoyl synthase [Candidatus Omnitrophota bacterium]